MTCGFGESKLDCVTTGGALPTCLGLANLSGEGASLFYVGVSVATRRVARE